MAKVKVNTNDIDKKDIMAIIRRRNLPDLKTASVEIILKEMNITIYNKKQMQKFRGKVLAAAMALKKE